MPPNYILIESSCQEESLTSQILKIGNDTNTLKQQMERNICEILSELVARDNDTVFQSLSEFIECSRKHSLLCDHINICTYNRLDDPVYQSYRKYDENQCSDQLDISISHDRIEIKYDNPNGRQRRYLNEIIPLLNENQYDTEYESDEDEHNDSDTDILDNEILTNLK